MTVQMGVTALVVVVPALLWERSRVPPPSPVFAAALLYLVLGGSVTAFLLYFWLLERMEVSRLSYQPVGSRLTGEQPGRYFFTYGKRIFRSHPRSIKKSYSHEPAGAPRGEKKGIRVGPERSCATVSVEKPAKRHHLGKAPVSR